MSNNKITLEEIAKMQFDFSHQRFLGEAEGQIQRLERYLVNLKHELERCHEASNEREKTERAKYLSGFFSRLAEMLDISSEAHDLEIKEAYLQGVQNAHYQEDK